MGDAVGFSGRIQVVHLLASVYTVYVEGGGGAIPGPQGMSEYHPRVMTYILVHVSLPCAPNTLPCVMDNVTVYHSCSRSIKLHARTYRTFIRIPVSVSLGGEARHMSPGRGGEGARPATVLRMSSAITAAVRSVVVLKYSSMFYGLADYSSRRHVQHRTMGRS